MRSCHAWLDSDLGSCQVGFHPGKGSDRTRRLAALASEQRTMVLFSAPGRVGRDLADLADALGSDRPAAVGRELTKLHEEVWHGTLDEALRRWPRDAKAVGEFTLVVAGADPESADPGMLLAEVDAEEAAGRSRSDAVRVVASRHDVSRRALYEAAIRGRGGA